MRSTSAYWKIQPTPVASGPRAGFAVAGTQISGATSPTYAALATASNWDRKYDRKRIPLAFVQTNG